MSSQRSQGHDCAGVFQLARQNSSVELVELHQVYQVSEFGGAVVKAEEDLTVLFTLDMHKTNGGKEGEITHTSASIFQSNKKQGKSTDYTNVLMLHVIIAKK